MINIAPVSTLPPDSLPTTQMKEQLSIAYIRMVVAAAGCTVASYSTDHDGVDISLRSSVEYPSVLGPQIDVQLKCTSQSGIVRDTDVAWRIDERTHKYLTSEKRVAPAILAVLVVPDDINSWLDHNDLRMLTESTMYWILGEQIPPLPNGQETITVKIPRKNTFNRDTLLGLMKAIGEGQISGH